MKASINKAILLGEVIDIHENKDMTITIILQTNKEFKNKETGGKAKQLETHRIIVDGPKNIQSARMMSIGYNVLVEGELKTVEPHSNLSNSQITYIKCQYLRFFPVSGTAIEKENYNY